MSILKQLLPSGKTIVEIEYPINDDELLDRQLQYPILYQ
jgi:hypothetical protein